MMGDAEQALELFGYSNKPTAKPKPQPTPELQQAEEAKPTPTVKPQQVIIQPSPSGISLKSGAGWILFSLTSALLTLALIGVIHL
jgi:hypothetical protein